MPSSKTLIQSIVLFVTIVGSYALYQNWVYNDNLEKEAAMAEYAGTHIMPNGEVMKGDGTVLSDATILPDGNIKLSDGMILAPAFDLRESESETADEMEGIMEMMDEPEVITEPEPVVEEVTTIEPVEEVPMIKENTDGTHIMPNGDVMKGDGTVLLDATILPDGNIELGDGSIIAPAFDLREKPE